MAAVPVCAGCKIWRAEKKKKRWKSVNERPDGEKEKESLFEAGLSPYSLTLVWPGLGIYHLAWHDSSQSLWLHPRGIPRSAIETACLGIQGQDRKADL